MAVKSFPITLMNEQGMTLPLVMILATVGVLIVLGLSKTVMSSAGLTADRNKIVTYETFVENMRNVMEDPAACTEMLEGIRIDTTAGAISQVEAIDSDFNEPANLASNLSTTDENIHQGWEDPEKSFGIDRMEVEVLGLDIPDRSQRPFDPDHYLQLANTALRPPVQKAYPIRFMFHPSGIGSKLLKESQLVDGRFEDTTDLTLENQKKSFQFENANLETLERDRADIRLFVNVLDMGGNIGIIQSCYGYNSPASICAASGGTYQYKDDPTDPFHELKCKPWKKCFQSPDGLVENPSQCPAPYNQVGADGLPLFTDQVGVVGGASKFLCNWCHPWPYDRYGIDEFGSVTSKTIEQLEAEWLRLAAMVEEIMPLVPDPLNPPPEHAEDLYKLATEWTYLESLSKELGVAHDTSTAEYQQAKALDDAVTLAETKIFQKKGEIMNIEYEVEDLNDELEALKYADLKYPGGVKQSDLNKLKAKVDDAQSAYNEDPSPANQQALEDAQGDYDSANAMATNPNLENDLKDQLATAESNLAQANSDLKTFESELATAEAEKDAFVSVDGQTADDYLDPIESVKTQLIDDYGIDESLVTFMDQVRGF